MLISTIKNFSNNIICIIIIGLYGVFCFILKNLKRYNCLYTYFNIFRVSKCEILIGKFAFFLNFYK